MFLHASSHYTYIFASFPSFTVVSLTIPAGKDRKDHINRITSQSGLHTGKSTVKRRIEHLYSGRSGAELTVVEISTRLKSTNGLLGLAVSEGSTNGKTLHVPKKLFLLCWCSKNK